MKLIVGLGNPGAKYTHNRHNIGFMALDAIAEANGIGPWRGKFQGQLAEGRLGSEKVLLLKPETFMNLSGQSVGEAMRFYKLTPEDVIVFHDELDLAPGKLRVKRGGGHAGHNGLRSMHQHIGPTYLRVRLGIGHPGDKRLVTPHVLGDFAKADQDWLAPLLQGIGKAAPLLAKGTEDKFMSQVAQSRPPEPRAPPKPKPPAPQVPAKQDQPPEPDTRSALQRLMDKFN
ncbi:aminoacyl-tRNA hydrolase [Oceanibium sediminis]|uniref:aminoacyl-tRNA hydrolase n=1 Tax=Oceanibium sediminis TaxID=2026339 RepID=UPI000DD36B28|nr:aminoacyl-tRNA hydrolase [Oceanibium sediminis]